VKVSGFYSPNFSWIGFILQKARAREEGLENLGDMAEVFAAKRALLLILFGVAVDRAPGAA
jgi:hypothetical protein